MANSTLSFPVTTYSPEAPPRPVSSPPHPEIIQGDVHGKGAFIGLRAVPIGVGGEWHRGVPVPRWPV